MPLAEYIGALREAQDILAHSGELAAVDRARAVLEGIDRVQLPRGAEIAVAPLLGAEGAALTQDAAAARVAARCSLSWMRQGMTILRRGWRCWTRCSPGPPFSKANRGGMSSAAGWPTWLDRLLPDAASRFPNSRAAGRAGDLIAWSIGILGVIAIVLLLAYWLRGLIGGFVANADGDEAGGGEDDLPQSPAEARQRAAGAANEGNYRGAVRNLYLAALLTLEQHGLVPADRSLTNREVLGRIGNTHPVRPHLQPVVETFDDVWYGVHEPDAGTYTAYAQSIDELETIAQRPDARHDGQGGPTMTAAAPTRGTPNGRRGGLARLFNRSNWPLLGLIGLAGLLLVVSALGSRPAQPIPFDLDSSTASGLRALDLWLQELGYDVQRIGGMQFRVPQDADLLFVYPNQLSYTEAEAEALHDWVAAGHTLVIVGPHPEDAELERVFGVRSEPRDGFGLTEQQRQPLVPEGEARVYRPTGTWAARRSTWRTRLARCPCCVAENGQVTAAVQQIGPGWSGT